MLSKIYRSILHTRFNFFPLHSFATKQVTGPNLMNDFTQIFQDKKEVPTKGRAWKAEELRLKSNEDLHKLWFVCVKQKNLLLADELVEKEFSEESSYKQRIENVRLTMRRILAVINQRQIIRRKYREELEKEYIEKKKQELKEKVEEQQKNKLPEITREMLRAKYHELRKGIDNVQYLERIWDKADFYKEKKERMEQRLSEKKIEPFKSFWEYETTQIGQRPLQEEVLRTQIKNWKSLNLKQRKIILGFLNARRAKDAKSAFVKELKILGEKIAYNEMKERVEKKNTQ